MRPEDEPEQEAVESGESKPKEKAPFSASLIESLTAVRSLSIRAALVTRPDVALAAVAAYCWPAAIFGHGTNSSLQLVLKSPNLRESCKAKDGLEAAR